MKLYSDNKVTISTANNLVQHDRTKHVKINRHFIKEKLESGTKKFVQEYIRINGTQAGFVGYLRTRVVGIIFDLQIITIN